MTTLDRLFSYFPLLMTAASFSALGIFAAWPSGWSVFVYVLPPIVLRILLRWTPIKPGVAEVDGRKFSAWLAAHHVQAFYDALPYLESLLRVIPGFYSMWLRMWGSRIGYGVEWPVRMDVLDRNLIEVGNRVTFATSNCAPMCAKSAKGPDRACWCARCALAAMRSSALARASAPAPACRTMPMSRPWRWSA
jgi:hypothetical protein